jgi:DNA repair exonuclease SbcCD ATPase subunit
VAAFAVLSAPAAAQQSQPSLAELARQEAARRKTIKDTKKVITAKDLPESARRPATAAPSGDAHGASPSAATGDQKPAAGAPGDAPAADGNNEAAWRARMTQAREGLRRNEVFLEALEMRVNGLNQDYDRHNAFERNTIGEARKKALAEIERVKADIELSKKQIADIEEDARKAGVPPGWLR